MTGLKTWNGSEWVTADSSTFDGTNHVDAPVNVWDGLQWVRVDSIANHRWKFDEGSGSTAADSIGSADGTINGATWNSGTWIGNYALDGDGTGDYVDTTTWGSFGSATDTNFAVAFTIQTTVSSGANILGVINDNDGMIFQVGIDISGVTSAGAVEAHMRDTNSNQERRYSSTNVDDGNKHRVVWNKTANSADGWEIWIDGQQDSATTERSQGFSAASNFDSSVYLFSRYNGGGPENHLNGTLDDVIISNDSWTSTEISDDYNQQPWS